MFDFDRAVDRLGTGSMKWAGVGAGHDVLAMGLADMDFPTAPAVIEALRRRVEHGAFGYTDVAESTIDCVAVWLGTRHGVAVAADAIVVSPGVLQSLALLLRAGLEPGAGVVVQTPAFSPIPDIVTANGFRVVENPLVVDGDRYAMDPSTLETLLAEPQVGAFVVCSPHNPVGRVWSEAELQWIVDVCGTHDVLMLSDEIHADLTYPWARFVSLAELATPDLRHAVLTGPSKAFNLPGLRTSVTIVPHAGLRQAFHDERHRVNEDFGVNALGVAALDAAYRDGARWLDALLTHLARNLDVVASVLADSRATVIRPEAMFLVWIDCRAADLGDDELVSALRDAGLIIEPGIAFGDAGSGFVRLNIATSRDRVIDAAGRLRDVVG